MSKKGIFKILIGFVFLASAVIWLLSVLMPDKFANLNLAWLLSAMGGAIGLIFIFRGLFSKTVSISKRLYILVGSALILGAVLALVGTLIDDKLILPIIAIAVISAGLLCMLAVGGKKWDTADNEKIGYKNYYQRKKEEEKKQNK